MRPDQMPSAPGRHLIWPHLAAAYLQVLYGLGRLAEAQRRGQDFLALAEREELGTVANRIRSALALAYASVGDPKAAIEQLQIAIDQYTSMGITGLNLGLVYETRARVAILGGDEENFRTFARLCAAQYTTGHNPALAAKYEKLIQAARLAHLHVSDQLAHAAKCSKPTAELRLTSVAAALKRCQGPRERAEYALEVLMSQSNCRAGFFYTMQKEGPVLVAQAGEQNPPRELDSLVKSRIASEIDERLDQTVNIADTATLTHDKGCWPSERDEICFPLLIAHYAEKDFAITGIAVMVLDPDAQYTISRGMIEVISKSLMEAGDVAVRYAIS